MQADGPYVSKVVSPKDSHLIKNYKIAEFFSFNMGPLILNPLL